MKETKAAMSVAPKSMTSALASLISSYGQDVTESESDKEPEGEQPPGEIILNIFKQQIIYLFILKLWSIDILAMCGLLT